MKRPPGPWLLCIAGILFHLQTIEAVRATSLIFSKTTTTTTTTAAPSEEVDDSTELPGLEINNTATKPPLTGIPQIDYIHDPNLPRELNGYNLTDYPFYDRIPPPEEMNFKCDGLHDGFYASVVHKCQVYHHCLYGTRYDFLCANFTAFDQKTFICHFASEVDCVNSPKYWHRNDALYKATTTSTQRTTTVYNPPEPPPRRPASGGRRRRPLRRRRPQYEEYYDDMDDYEQEYEEEPRFQATSESPRSGGRRRKRPQRPRRPQYDDDEYEYDDDRYERRPYDRRGSDDRYDDRRRNKDRPKDRQRPREDDEERESDKSHEDDKRYDERKRPATTGEGRRSGKPKEDRRSESRRPTGSGGSGSRRQPTAPAAEDDEYGTKPRNKPARKYKDDYEDEDRKEERRPFDRERPNRKNTSSKEDSAGADSIKSSEERDRDRPRKNPSKDDALGEDRRDRDRERNRDRDRPRKNQNRDEPDYKDDSRENSGNEKKVLVKPNTGSSVYDRPRVPPRIRPPVPIKEQEKYAYKTTKSTTSKPLDDEYYYDDEEEEPRPPPPPKKPNRGDVSYESRRASKPTHEEKRSSGSRLRPISRDPDSEEERVEESRTTPKSLPKIKPRTQTPTPPPPPPAEEEYYDDYEDSAPKSEEKIPKPEAKVTTTKPPPEVTTPKPSPKPDAPVEQAPRERNNEPYVRVHKRPFLPSRGGNPYTARGLQPLGTKAVVPNPTKNTPEDTSVENPPPEEQTVRQLPMFKKNKPRESIPIYEDDNRENSKPQLRQEQLNEQPSGPKVTLRTYSEDKPRYTTVTDDKNFKPSPPLMKLTDRPAQFNPEKSRPQQQHQSQSNQQKTLPSTNFNNQKITVNAYKTVTQEVRTTQKPKVQQQETRNPLDINGDEYDVTLNDALNPTLPNLPVRGFPTGFSSTNDYTWTQYQSNRNRYNPTAAESYKVQQAVPLRPSSIRNSPADLFPSGSGQIKSYQVQNFRQTPRQTSQYYSIF